MSRTGAGLSKLQGSSNASDFTQNCQDSTSQSDSPSSIRELRPGPIAGVKPLMCDFQTMLTKLIVILMQSVL